MYFSKPQISLVNKVFSKAEDLVGGFFRMAPRATKAWPYDVKTLASLEKHEVSDTAFAHLCRYEIGDPGGRAGQSSLYRICLQDNRILNAVERGTPFIQFAPLMTYIAVHELVHVVRFNNGDSEFDLSPDERELEEEKVHGITRKVLEGISIPGFGMVLECFSNRYKIN